MYCQRIRSVFGTWSEEVSGSASELSIVFTIGFGMSVLFLEQYPLNIVNLLDSPVLPDILPLRFRAAYMLLIPGP